MRENNAEGMSRERKEGIRQGRVLEERQKRDTG
jgi:hypothetical protein